MVRTKRQRLEMSKLSEEKVVALLMGWIVKKLKDTEGTILRMRIAQEVYDVALKNIQSKIYVRTIRKRQKIKQLYLWQPNEVFSEMTFAKLRSARRIAEGLCRQ